MKPFLLLQHRYLDEASDNEYQAVLKYGGLQPVQLHRIRMEKASISRIKLQNYSGIITGGGPANVSDPEEHKRPEQRRFERELDGLYEQIFEYDFPYLGMCYGMGSVIRYLGGDVSSKRFGEPVGATTIRLNTTAHSDPLLNGLPSSFKAFVGHKEACQFLPSGATLLAGSEACPVQMIRAKTNIYATQFHPELDTEGIAVRINVYRHHGYFNPEEAEHLIAQTEKEDITHPQLILRNFVERYSQSLQSSSTI